MHKHTHEPPLHTEGRLIRWGSSYDMLVNILTLGQARRLRRMTVDLALLETGDSVLDVGCGTGAVTLPAKQSIGDTGEAAGIDPSPEMIEVARHKARRAGLEIDFRVGVIEALPYPDEAFEAVTSSLMMHHLPEPLQIEGLAEIMRVLKPGGRLLIADMRRPGTSLIERISAHLNLHHGHRHRVGIENLIPLLERVGFEEINLLEARFLFVGFLRARKPA
jgi:ubiquinone/menaquinone biosynthesis C-methylase UbiE